MHHPCKISKYSITQTSPKYHPRITQLKYPNIASPKHHPAITQTSPRHHPSIPLPFHCSGYVVSSPCAVASVIWPHPTPSPPQRVRRLFSMCSRIRDLTPSCSLSTSRKY